MNTDPVVKRAVSLYKKIKPDWMPPHKTIFSAAKHYGFTAIIDGLSEKEFDKKWEKLFEDGVLEGYEGISVVLKKDGEQTKLRFNSDNLRDLYVDR